MIILETKRLILRTWQENDISLMCEINQDKRVMEYFPSTVDKDGTYELINKINSHYDKYGYTLYAVEIKSTNEFIGFIGLLTPNFTAHFTPNTEIGWRLKHSAWGHGYATEGAKAVLDYAFTNLKLPQVVSFTVMNNIRSRRVMEKIGLKHRNEDDFLHPNLPKDSPLSLHVLYRLKKSEYKGY